MEHLKALLLYFSSVYELRVCHHRKQHDSIKLLYDVEFECGGYLDEESGEFTSPDYPSYYPRNAECVWTIKVSDGNRIGLNITHSNFQSCDPTYIRVNSPVIFMNQFLTHIEF